MSQTCCRYNVMFAQVLKEPAFAPRDVLAEKDTRTLAREPLSVTQAEFSAASKGSPIKRATHGRGGQRRDEGRRPGAFCRASARRATRARACGVSARCRPR